MPTLVSLKVHFDAINRVGIISLLIYEGRFSYVRRVVDLMQIAIVNAYIMNIFGKIELLSIHAAFKMHYFNDFQEAKTYLYISGTGNMVEI